MLGELGGVPGPCREERGQEPSVGSGGAWRGCGSAGRRLRRIGVTSNPGAARRGHAVEEQQHGRGGVCRSRSWE